MTPKHLQKYINLSKDTTNRPLCEKLMESITQEEKDKHGYRALHYDISANPFFGDREYEEEVRNWDSARNDFLRREINNTSSLKLVTFTYYSSSGPKTEIIWQR